MGPRLAFYYSFALVFILSSTVAHPRFDMDAYCAELYREARRRLWVVRIRLFSSTGKRGISDSNIDGIALLDIVWGLHDQK